MRLEQFYTIISSREEREANLCFPFNPLTKGYTYVTISILHSKEINMSVFKRANWHSGLTYRQVCSLCKTTIEYTDDKLDYRPWFADGFVYCPTCKKPLRHNEKFAINEQPIPTNNSTYRFCGNCGFEFKEAGNFCPNCGTKR